MNGGTRLRLARQARGLSQQQLAGAAGVTRQAVSALESGLSDPSLRVALALAGALGMTVDELFGPEGALPEVPARLVGDEPDRPKEPGGVREPGGVPAPSRVTLAPVGESLVALPLFRATASRAGFLPAGGVVTAAGQRARVRPLAPPRPTLVVAGCDPALPLLAEPLGLLDPPIAFTWWPCSSEEALRLAGAGLVHAAGVHAAAPPDVDGLLVGFSAWREGLVLGPSATGITSVADLAGRGLRLVNREPGAQARQVLDREFARLGIAGADVPGYGTTAAGHLQVADAIAAGLADVGVAAEPSALAYGLDFIPLAAERFDLVIHAAQTASREVQALIRVLSSRWLLDQLASLPGYDPAPCGQRVVERYDHDEDHRHSAR